MRRNSEFLSRFILSLMVLFALPAGVLAQTVQVRPLVTQAVDESQMTVLKGNVHPLALPQYDQGPAPASLPMQRMLLVLKHSAAQETALQQLLSGQQDKNSPNYHKWLTPAQYGAQFGPADEDVQAVSSWLESHGFQIAKVAKGKNVIEFSGTAGQVQEAFRTAIHKFVVNGEEHWANATNPQIPTALAPVLGGIQSLHNFRMKPANHVAGLFSRNKETGRLTPLATSKLPAYTVPVGCTQPNCNFGMGPFDFATIYDVLPLWNGTAPATRVIDGTGVTIAIVAESNINIQDVRDFRTFFGLPANDPVIVLDGPDPGITGDETENLLDSSWSGAVAKGATIDLVVSASTDTTQGIILSMEYIIDTNLAGIMSTSYAGCELEQGTGGNEFISAVWEQAAAQGISSLIATGDSGAANCDANQGAFPQPAEFGLAVNGLASTPFNVAVGGTDFNQFNNTSTYWNLTNNTNEASAKSYIPETTWNNSCTNAIFALVGGSANPETNCNNTNLDGQGQVFVATIGGGGGASNCITSDGADVSSCAGGYAKPVWQTGTGVPADGVRDIPDVSLFASNGFLGTFYVLCEADVPDQGLGSCNSTSPETPILGIGGTSASTPSFAGIMALVQEQTGSRQGNANFVLYKLAALHPTAFHDVPAGSTNSMPCAQGSPDCRIATTGDTIGLLTIPSTTTPGYSTTTGYDLATGWGSVDAAVLVTDWSSVTFTPTTTTLSLTVPAGFVHGQSATVHITVAPTTGSGTPSGDVSLVAPGQGIDGFTLSNGAVSSTTTQLPGGTYAVTAHYAGDGTFGASDSAPVTVTVGKEGSATAIAVLTANSLGEPITFTSGPYGSFVYPKATVSPDSGNGVPTGTVSFTDTTSNPNLLAGNPYSLNAEGATAPPNGIFTFSAGSHSIGGTYSGDASFNGGTATTASFTITQVTPTITLVPSSTSITLGATVTLTANLFGATAPANPPSGTVTFFTGTTQLGTPVTLSALSESSPSNSESTAALVTNQLPSGSNNVTAKYSGDTNYPAVTSAISTIMVTGTATSTTTAVIATPPTPVTQGTSVFFTATVTPGTTGGPTLTGTVQFKVNGTNLGTPVTISSDMAQSAATTTLPAGSLSVTAVYSGDANYAGSTSPALTYVVTTVTTTTTAIVAAPPSPQTVGTSVTFTATVTPGTTGGPTMTGTVQFAVNGTNLGTAVTISGGVAHSIATTTMPIGANAITAVYSGDSNYSTSTGNLTDTVTTITTSTGLTAAPPSPVTVGTSVVFTATVTPGTTGGPTMTGTVQFKVNGTNLGSPVTISAGVAQSAATTTLPVGANAITAVYSGDSNYGTSTSSTLTYTVNMITTTTGLTAAPPTPVTQGTSVVFTATVTPGTTGGPTMTGTVQFKVNGTNLGTAVTIVGGVAQSAATTTLPVGANAITAVYSGDSSYGTSTSTTLTYTVTAVVSTTTAIVAAPPSPQTVGTSVTFTATVTPGTTGGPTMTGTVQFKVNGTNLGTAVTISGGVAHSIATTAATLPIGANAITAVYSGDINYGTSTGNLTDTVNAITTTTGLTAAPPSPVTVGTSVVFTATVTPGTTGGPTLTGTVQFKVNGTNLGTPVTIVAGVAQSAATTTLPVGANAITAVYSGDSNYGTSTSSTLTYTVNAITTTTGLTAAPPSPAFQGQSVVFTATVTPGTTGGPTMTGTVQFKVNGTNLGSAVTISAGVAQSAATTTLPTGADAVTAVYSGDANYSTSTSGTLTYTVTAVTTTTAVTATSASNPIIQGSTVTLAATVTQSPGAAPVATGTVQFQVDGTNLGAAVTLSGTGTASTTSTTIAQGSHTITANYSGDYASSSGTAPLTVNAAYTLAANPTTVTIAMPGGSGSDYRSP